MPRRGATCRSSSGNRSALNHALPSFAIVHGFVSSRRCGKTSTSMFPASACVTARRTFRFASRLSCFSELAVVIPAIEVFLRDRVMFAQALYNGLGILLAPQVSSQV